MGGIIPVVPRASEGSFTGSTSPTPSPATSSSNSTTTATMASRMEQLLSCPYPTTDGVASSGPAVQTEGTVEAMRRTSFQNATALAIEAWFTPVFSDEVTWAEENLGRVMTLPILTIGREVSEDLGAGSVTWSDRRTPDFDWCEGLQLSIAQRGDLLEVRYRDYFNPYFNDDWANTEGDDYFSCRILVIRNWKLVLQELHHVVLIWQKGGGMFEIYGNGSLVSRINLLPGGDDDEEASLDDSKYDLSSWDGDYRLQLFANDLVSGTFPGTIHRVAIYNHSMSEDTVRRIYEEGVSERSRGIVMDPNNPIHLVANPSRDAVRTVQGRPVALTVGGNSNVSTPHWDIMVEMTSLPRHGVLSLMDGRKISLPGERLPLDQAQSRTQITYRQHDDAFFTTPTHSFYGRLIFPPDVNATNDDVAEQTRGLASSESFTYRLVAVDKIDSSKLLGWSDPIVQDVHIVHVNHPPYLESPEVVSVPDRQPAEVGSRPWAALNNAVLHDDADHNIDRVRVDLWVSNGTLSIESEEIRQMADFESCSSRLFETPESSLEEESLLPLSPWSCFGDGLTDRNMTFLATPDNVSTILSNIRYQAFFWDQEDAIILRIFDGVGGPCLREEEHLSGRLRPSWNVTDGSMDYYSTAHESCFSIAVAIQIPPLRQTFSAGDVGVRGLFKELFDFKGFGIPDLIFWICFVCSVMACCCCFHVLNKLCCCFKGAKIEVEDGPSNQEVTLAPLPTDDHLVWATINGYNGSEQVGQANESV
jgi:hypothetical protein